jgi:hypothetical protein
MNKNNSKSAIILHTIHIMTVARQSPLLVHNVAGKAAIFYLHHEGTQRK